MRQAKRPGRAGERPRFSGRSNFQQGGRGEKFKAICSECGQDCYLPFKPSSHKPVYCDTCFQGHRLISPQKSSQFIAKKFPQLDQVEQLRLQEKLEMMNAKLEKILEFVSQVSRQIKELDFPQPQEIIKQAKSGAKELKKNLEDKQAKLKSIKTDTKKLGQELKQDAKVIKKAAAKGAKTISKTIAKDVKKVKKEVKKIVKEVKKTPAKKTPAKKTPAKAKK